MHVRGIIVPLITPLGDDESLDEPGLERLVEHVIAGGVAAIFVLGTSGEFPALRAGLKERLVTATCTQVAGRVPVLAGVADAGTRLAVEQARGISNLGVDAVVVTAPYYFFHSQAELVGHISAVAAAADVPTIVYNIPHMVKNLVDREAMSLLLKNPTIQGIKDSSGDLVRFQELLELRVERPGFQVWQGAEALAALSIIRGADGAVLGLANIAPALCCQLYQAAAHGDLTAAWALQNRLLHLYRIQEHRSFLAGLKTAAMQLGLCRARVTDPFEPLDQSQQAAVRRTLVELGLLPE